jgi:hypothetical protein
MNLYVESSAVVAWLLGQSKASVVQNHLDRADLVFSSDLLLVECDRTLIRAEAAGALSAAESAGRRAALNQQSAYWMFLGIEGEVLERARRPFPLEPVRSLDALHLASLLVVRSIFADAEVLSFDERIRGNATALGFQLAPT